ncbi:MAG: homocysteine S-methyltransferase family protein [Deltaproteobacteria bacterium]|nr:homocysteine S-methyltransferase family protein [Deltaproteobacteria bacterium]
MSRHDLLKLAQERILVMDGAMGTSILAAKLGPKDFGGHPGCNEFLVRSRPDVIETIHRDYLEAGAELIQTNTFSASATTLAEHGLADGCERLNREAAELARKCADAFSTPDAPRFVGASVGPGAKLATLGQIDYATLYAGYLRQMEGLVAGGVDLIMVETVQDLLQAKAAIAAARDAMGKRALPIYLSVTVEESGTLLTGPDMEVVAAVVAPLELDFIGLNCATGPSVMAEHLAALARHTALPLGVYPNAGLPVSDEKGGLRYDLADEDFAAAVVELAKSLPIHLVGGCCGTTPETIRVLVEALAGLAPRQVDRSPRPASLASTFQAVTLRQTPAPLFIGERANATGSKAFREALQKGDLEEAFDRLTAQAETGAHVLDLSCAHVSLDELGLMEDLCARAAQGSRLPLCIDSETPEVMEAALRLCPGRVLLNSIHLEDGGKRAAAVCRLAKRHGAAIIALTIDEEGMAMDVERKLTVAKRLHRLVCREHGLRPQDLFIDALTFAIASGEPSLRGAAKATLEAIRRIKHELPGVGCVLGVSNVSYGLSLPARRVLNSVFLHLAVEAGLDAAILHPRQIQALAQLADEDRRAAEALIMDVDGQALERFILRFAARDDELVMAVKSEDSWNDEEAVFQGVLQGRVRLIFARLDALLTERAAESIVADVLVPAMQRVGELFAEGRLQLPFVLKSAEAMKRAVDSLEPHFAAGAESRRYKLLLATVRGDVHDIGKNLVDIIVSNNGFDVVNMGVRVPASRILDAVARHKPDVLGLSGLLVSSSQAMAEDLARFHAAGLRLPVLVGGAALTRDFVRERLRRAYPEGSVIYCADAFSGLQAMQALAAGKEPEQAKPARPQVEEVDAEPVVATRLDQVEAPKPAFLGSRVARDLNLDLILEYVNKEALFRSRWGYRQRQLQAFEHRRIIKEEAEPRFDALIRLGKEEELFAPRMVYGFYEARAENETLWVKGDSQTHAFAFPRRNRAPSRCLADFVRPDADVVGFFVVTLGGAVALRGREVFAKNEYLDYFLLHGLAVELTEALAEYAHEVMRHGLGIGEDHPLSPRDRTRKAYRGARFGFGYSCCPDLAAHERVFELLQPERIGVRLSETHQMIPEYSTAALVLHHPQARPFKVD